MDDGERESCKSVLSAWLDDYDDDDEDDVFFFFAYNYVILSDFISKSLSFVNDYNFK